MTIRWDSNSADATALKEKLRSGEVVWNVRAGQVLTTVFPEWKGKYVNSQVRNGIAALKTQLIKEHGGIPPVPVPGLDPFSTPDTSVARLPPPIKKKAWNVEDGKFKFDCYITSLCLY
jgi:hypothetical protein